MWRGSWATCFYLVGSRGIENDRTVVTLRFENGALDTLTSGYYLDRGYDAGGVRRQAAALQNAPGIRS